VQEYQYEVVDRQGQSIKGSLEADSPLDAIRRLSADGRTVVEVAEVKPRAVALFTRKLSRQELVIGLHELATLLESGVSLSDAVQAQSRGSYHPELSRAFSAIARTLMRGGSLLEAMRDSQLDLPDYLYHLVEAGEATGRLAQSLRQSVAQMEYDLRVAGDIRNALIYPSILIFSGIAAVLLVFVFVVPQFANLLEDGNDLPWLAETVLRTGVFFNDYSGWLLGGAVLTIAAAGSLLRQKALRQRLTNVFAGLPVLNDWLSEADTARWASVMAAMLTSRVELMEALDLALRGVRISRRFSKLERVLREVRGGVALSAALEKEDALTATGYNLIRVGEQSGQLPEMLRSLAVLYEENSARRMKRFLTLIEPLAILLIGGFLGTIMVGIILAITSVNEIAI
jgi:general secretion pathway protein F